MTTEQLYVLYKEYPSVQTDTRKIKEGDIFFALKGEKFDGNSFTARAFEEGASYAIIDDPAYADFSKTIVVDDVLTTLHDLARYHREQLNIPFLAITGSNGKTTTKELIHLVLSTTFKTYTTEGNLNNHIGIPLTILKVKEDAEIAVIEMGANHPGEIASYCRYALPTHGLVTNCGKAHLEGFGNEEGVRKSKGELFDYLRDQKGVAFIMNDYDYLREMSSGIPLIKTYGTVDADITGNVISNKDFLLVTIANGADIPTLKTRLVGDYNLPNVLAAVAVGKFFNVSDNNIKEAIETYSPSNSRSQLLTKGTNKIILDAYNANPTSMKIAIEHFSKMPDEKKVLLLGAMAELGNESLAEHQLLISTIDKYNWHEVVLVGGDLLKVKHPYVQFTDVNAAGEWLKEQHFTDCAFLLKGSRSIQMEKLLEFLV